MKKMLVVLAALCLMMTAVMGVAAVSTDKVTYGDLNGDGDVTNRDLALMQQYINGWDVEVDFEVADVNADGEVTNRDLALLQQYINGWEVELGPEEDEDDNYFNDTELDWNF